MTLFREADVRLMNAQFLLGLARHLSIKVTQNYWKTDETLPVGWKTMKLTK